jgi:anti-anti-sigma factor
MLFQIEFLPDESAEINEDDCGNYAVRISLRGNLSIENAAEVSLLFRTFARGGVLRVIVNMDSLFYIDSTGISALIRSKKALVAEGGDIALVNVPPKINEVFDLVSLKEYIKCFYDEKKALEYLDQSVKKR